MIQLDIPRDTVSIVCNIKSTRGHTSIHLTPWESRAQYKKWNKETYKPHDKASHLIERFHAAERRARSIWQSRWLSLYCVAHAGWMCPSQRGGPHHRHPATENTYHDEEDRTGHADRPLNKIPTYEEAFHGLGRAPTVADLGPHSPGSCPSSLVPYTAEGDSNPEEEQDQQRMTPEQMETEEPAMMEASAKEGMGITVGPENYQPAPPRYVRANKNSDTDEEDIKAPYLAPRQAPPPKPSQDELLAQTPSKDSQTPTEDLQESSGKN